MIWVLLAVILLLSYAVLPTIYHKYLQKHEVAEDKRILLTFDDGPDEQYTEKICDLLEHYGIHAVFFVVAEKAQKYPQVLDYLQSKGNTIGFHGLTHRNMWFLGYRQSKKNFREGIKILQNLGVQPNFYRSPYGSVNIFTLILAAKYGLMPLWWTTMIGDWKNVGSNVLLERLRSNVGNGSVICLHDSGEGTGGEVGAASGTFEALQIWLPEVLAQGYRFVEPKQLFVSDENEAKEMVVQ